MAQLEAIKHPVVELIKKSEAETKVVPITKRKARRHKFKDHPDYDPPGAA